jgi:hypothetical protein
MRSRRAWLSAGPPRRLARGPRRTGNLHAPIWPAPLASAKRQPCHLIGTLCTNGILRGYFSGRVWVFRNQACIVDPRRCQFWLHAWMTIARLDRLPRSGVVEASTIGCGCSVSMRLGSHPIRCRDQHFDPAQSEGLAGTRVPSWVTGAPSAR